MTGADVRFLFCRFAGEAIRANGEIIPAAVPGLRNIVIKQPIGVCSILACWSVLSAHFANIVSMTIRG